MKANLPDPDSAPELFSELLPRRVFAYLIDIVLIGLAALLLALCGIVLGFVTFGLAWLSMPLVLPLAIIGYYALTLGSSHRATVGMSLMDIVLTPARGTPLDGWKVLLHPLLFWLTIWISWPVSLLFALFTPRQQMLHDLVLGTLMVRRSPMARHWAAYGTPDGQRV